MNISLSDVLDDWPLWGLTTKPITENQVTPLIGGLTNECYQLSLDSGEYIIRISAENTQALGINRTIEKSIHQLVSTLQFTSELRYCDDEDRYWIRDYIMGESLDANGNISDNTLSYMVEQLKALHHTSIDLSLPRVNISEKAEAYWCILEAREADKEMLKMKALMQVAMSEPPEGTFCLCHFDPVPANWLYTPEGLKLLDWEYAGLGHPFWDLSALLQGIVQGMNSQNCSASVDELSAQEDHLEQRIIELYGIEDLTSWRRAKVQMEYLSSLWYKAQS
jgi:thiamine kinase-like enzyme